MKIFKFNGKKYYFRLTDFIDGGTKLELYEKGAVNTTSYLTELITNEDGMNIFAREPDKICWNPDIAPEFFVFLQRQGFMTDTGKVEMEAGMIYPVMKLNLEKIRRYTVNG